MRNAVHFLGRGPRGTDRKAVVDLQSVGGNHLAAEVFGKMDAKPGLAGGRRADDRHDGLTAHTVLRNIRSRSARDNSTITGRPCGQVRISSRASNSRTKCSISCGGVLLPALTAARHAME